MARTKRAAATVEEALPAAKLLKGERRMESVDAVRPHPLNANVGDVAAIRESIRTNGFYGDVFVWKQTGEILVGNHRWAAAKAEGLKRLPMTFLDLTEAEALRILAVDNRTRDQARYDDKALVTLLRRIVDTSGSFTGSGFDQETLDSALRRIEAPPRGKKHDTAERGGMQLLRTCPSCGHQF